MEIFHQINIITHVTAGLLSLMLGLWALIVVKGGPKHLLFGKYFTRLVAVVILTGLIGVFVYHRNTFLLVITLLSGYTCFSGIRAIRLRGHRPKFLDYLAPFLVTSSALYYLYYIRSIGMYWAPAVTYSTMFALFMVTLYDLFKVFMSQSFLIKAYLYEHVYKMVSAFIALASAFSGTVLPQYQPYSQLLPSVFGFIYIIATFIRLSARPLTLKQN